MLSVARCLSVLNERQFGTSADTSRQFGTCVEVSDWHFGASAKMSWVRTVPSMECLYFTMAIHVHNVVCIPYCMRLSIRCHVGITLAPLKNNVIKFRRCLLSMKVCDDFARSQPRQAKLVRPVCIIYTVMPVYGHCSRCIIYTNPRSATEMPQAQCQEIIQWYYNVCTMFDHCMIFSRLSHWLLAFYAQGFGKM